MLGELLRKRTVSLHLTFKALRLYRLVLLVLSGDSAQHFSESVQALSGLGENQKNSLSVITDAILTPHWLQDRMHASTVQPVT